MRKILIKLIIALALLASVFVCNGVAYAEANSCWNVRLEINYNGDKFAYDLAQNISADAESSAQNASDYKNTDATNRGFYLGANGKKRLYDELTELNLPPLAVYEYILPNFGKVLDHFAYVNKQKVDATVSFDASGFHYREGNNGVAINAKKLFEAALNSGGKVVKMDLPLTVDKAVTVAELKKNTVKRASFTTTYASSGANRCFNIAKAASSLNGITVGVGETFSFNNTVGARTEERGYKTSKVILDGNYTDGVGGGVCQVSTTLYNALLLAGFIPKASQHSLISGYVKAGFDAMVSYGVADLTFTNDTDHPIYIAAVTQNKAITFTIYGEPTKYRIERESVEEREKFRTVEIVDKVKYPELIYTDQTKVVTAGSDGVKTQSYLKYYVGDKLVETKLIRKNTYKRVDQVVARGDVEREIQENE